MGSVTLWFLLISSLPSPLPEITQQQQLGGLCGDLDGLFLPGEQDTEEKGGSCLCQKKSWAWAILCLKGSGVGDGEWGEGKKRHTHTHTHADQLGDRKMALLAWV